MPRGTLMLIMGGMFAGKTGKLLMEVKTRRKHGKKNVLVIKPDIDTRSPRCARSHDGKRIRAYEVPSKNPAAVLDFIRRREKSKQKRIDTIAIDEVHFFTDGYRLIDELLDLGYDVIAAGVAHDFRTMPLGCTLTLLGLCDLDNLLVLKAHCVKCGERTLLTQRLINGRPAPYNSPAELVGGAETYEPRCRKHLQVPGRPRL